MAVRDELLEKMMKLASSYVPEWSFTEENPDAGSVVALLYKEMLQGSMDRYEKVLHKHKIQYLNLFDRFKVEPAEAAKSFVQFTPVAGTNEPVSIPKGTRLLADSTRTDTPIVFETTQGITVTPASITDIFTTNGKEDTISRQFAAEDGSPEQCAFTAFRTGDDNLAEHTLLLGYDQAFEHLHALDLTVSFSTSTDEDAEAVLEAIRSEQLTFSILCENGFEPFDTTAIEGGSVWLKKEDCALVKAPLAGVECYQIALTASKHTSISVHGISIRFEEENIPPDELLCSGIAQNAGHFWPFGVPMEMYATTEMESKSVFARIGADVTLSFSLDYQVLEQLLPQYEVENEYKIVMRKAPTAPKPVIQEVYADYALLEYLSTTGWKRLVKDEHAAMLFNGSERGEIAISFVMPTDMIHEQYADAQPRMRLRLLRTEKLYHIPCRQHCPIIKNLRYSYSYAERTLAPSRVVSRNNFEHMDVTSLFEKGKTIVPFYSKEHENPTIYLGFDTNPWGAPLSIYFGIENSADIPVDFLVEYRSPTGFLPLKVADGTGGLRNSGAMRMIVAQDAAPETLFGQERYWIRLISKGDLGAEYLLPNITGVFLNMAKVENVRTQTQFYYQNSGDSALHINLGAVGLIAAKVYVNEENGEDGDNWVLWEKAEFREQQGRVYDIDLAAGHIAFTKNRFATVPLKEDAPAVKVVFQSYHGASANVGAGKINTLASSIRYISEVKNPVPAFGGYSGFSEETSAAIISNMLRTRGRAVSKQDYFDLISQVSYGVRRVKSASGVNPQGKPQEDVVTIAVLIDEYEKGGHIFSGVKEAIRDKLLSCSGMLPAGKKLELIQPRFVRMSVRIWLQCESMESIYEVQQECNESIRRFIDPLRGGFDGKGWEIGVLPTPTQLVAYLKIRHPDTILSKILMTAVYEKREYPVDDRIAQHITSPFTMAVNGEHRVYSELMEGEPC